MYKSIPTKASLLVGARVAAFCVGECVVGVVGDRVVGRRVGVPVVGRIVVGVVGAGVSSAMLNGAPLGTRVLGDLVGTVGELVPGE